MHVFKLVGAIVCALVVGCALALVATKQKFDEEEPPFGGVV